MKCMRCADAYHQACCDKKHSLRLNRNCMVCPKHFEDGRTFRWGNKPGRKPGSGRKPGRPPKRAALDSSLPRRKSSRQVKRPKNGYAEFDKEDEGEEESSSEESSSEESTSED